MNAIFSIFMAADFWNATFVAIAPMLLAVFGALLCGRAGVIHLGSEGLFAAGAVTGFLLAHVYGTPQAGLAGALAAGAIIGLAHGILISPLGLPQRETGIAVTILAVGIAQFVFPAWLPSGAGATRITTFAPIIFPPLPSLPQLGKTMDIVHTAISIFELPALVYLVLALACVIAYVLTRTPFGLALTAMGENPEAVATQGRSVHRLRIEADIAGSALMALGGATMALTGSGAFSFGPLNGRGFAALALAAAARWRPGWALLAAVLFGIVDVYQARLQPLAGGSATGAYLPLAPFILAFLVLAAANLKLRRAR